MEPLDEGHRSDVVDSISEEFSSDTEDETELKPYFRNWGGEAPSSHFLIGREWNRPQNRWYEPLGQPSKRQARRQARREAAMAKFGQLRSKLIAKQGVIVLVF